MAENGPLVAQDGDVGELFGTAPGATLGVVIAGPTLRRTRGWVARRRQEGPVIAVDAALAPLLEVGVTPDVVVTADAVRENVARYFAGDLSPCGRSTLVYLPVVHRSVLKRWPGRRLAAYTAEDAYRRIRRRLPKAELFIAGSVAHLAVDLAVHMGAARVLLFGADFGFPGGALHANREAPVAAYRSYAAAGRRTLNGRGEPIATLASFVNYLRSLERYIAAHPSVRFTNTSRDGAMIAGTDHLDPPAG
jgi:hypothetical protein